MTTISVRYIVNDVEAAITFYTKHLGFEVDLHPAPGFASLSRGNLRLLLSKPGAGGAGQAMPDGRQPEPGGWNRIQLEVSDLASNVECCARPAPVSATTLSSETAANKSCLTIPPATASSYLNRR